MIYGALLLLFCATGALGWWIAGEKDRNQMEGAALGFLFGPIGALIEALLPNGEPKKEFTSSLTGEADEGIDDSRAAAYLNTLQLRSTSKPPPLPPPEIPEWLKGVTEDRPPSGPPRINPES